MGLFEKIFTKVQDVRDARTFFKTLNGYTPTWHSWSGCIYEVDLVRASIDARARHNGKLRCEVNGSAKPFLQTRLRKKPNEWQTWSQFVYRASTILDVQNTLFIVPIFSKFGETIGIYPICPLSWELVQTENNDVWIRFHFKNGKIASLRLAEVGILTKFQYDDDFFGSSNRALNDTMQLISIQNQGITEAIKSSATYRFMATVKNFTKPDDLKKERENFSAENFGQNTGGGLLLFPNTYGDIKQIDSKPYTVNALQREQIQKNVFDYYSVNEDILQGKAFGDSLNAFYESAVEPFAIQLSEVLTKMLFTDREIAEGTEILFTANRLQYMSNSDKLNVSSQLLDRGIFSLNEVREIWNLAPIPNGDRHIIRGEYYDLAEKQSGGQINEEEETTDEN